MAAKRPARKTSTRKKAVTRKGATKKTGSTRKQAGSTRKKTASKKASPKRAAGRRAAKAGSDAGAIQDATVERLQRLIELMHNHGAVEVEFEEAETRLRIRLQGDGSGMAMPAMAHPGYAAAPVVHAAPAPMAPAAAAVGGAAEAAPEGETYNSPMVGTFYKASSPEAEPFVRPGDTVSEDSTVCILEAMKVMNEIKAESRFEVLDILVENGDAVEYGQPLFRIRSL